ncbi:MAG: PAS domain-containing protein, partial [Candidatus Velamenicoccus archaeovorus]
MMEARLSAAERGGERGGLIDRVFRASSQGILIARLDDGVVAEANDAFLYLIGRDHDEVVGASVWALGLFAGLGDERAARLLRDRGAIDGFDAHVSSRAGESRVLRLWAEAVVTDEGSLAIVRASDVDGRAAAGARYHQLREAEVRYRALVEQIPAITYTQVADETSPTGTRDIYVSPQTTKILGVTPDEWMLDPELWERILHPEDRDRVVSEDRRTTATGDRFSVEYRALARDGRVVWFRDEAVLVEDPVSGVSFWQGLMLDITQIKEAEHHHAELEAKYRTLVEQIPAVVYLGEYGDDGDWLYISPQLENVLGYTPEEWLAHPHPMASFTHPDDLAAARAAEEESLRTGRPMRAEYRMRAKDGRWVWILDEATAVRDEAGTPFVLQGVMYDVTERKRSEQELADALERLRQMDALKATLLHTLSHDLKGPLTAILGAASTLERLDRELPESERRAMLQSLASRTTAINTLLTDLLDLDRLDQGIVEPRRFPVDLAELAREMIRTNDLLVGREVTVQADRLVVAVDRPKVERMLENLLTNAARHTAATTRVWVRVERVDRGALLVVEDDGPGVPDQEKERIFETFRRGSGAAELPGSGIGLSLVARFAELHGGRAWVEDRPGGG